MKTLVSAARPAPARASGRVSAVRRSSVRRRTPGPVSSVAVPVARTLQPVVGGVRVRVVVVVAGGRVVQRGRGVARQGRRRGLGGGGGDDLGRGR